MTRPFVETLDEFLPVVRQFRLNNDPLCEFFGVDGATFEYSNRRGPEPSFLEIGFIALQAEYFDRVIQLQQNATQVEQ
jgi:hypothetical protein